MSWTVQKLIRAALDEDVGSGDLTSRYFVPIDQMGTARLFAKEPGVLAGVDIAAEVFSTFDSTLQPTIHLRDGHTLTGGDTVLTVHGSVRSLLTAERTALNFLQRLSGIASQTKHFVNLVQGTSARILDTRKTTPGWREIEKKAVAAGGGTNHRFGLHDMVMVKDNHLLAENRIDHLRHAIEAFKKDHPQIRIELEADRLEQVQHFLTLDHIDVILLDNMSPVQLRECVSVVRNSGRKIDLEASGGVNERTVRAIAETGVDFISIGALTHTVKALDFSLELTEA